MLIMLRVVLRTQKVTQGEMNQWFNDNRVTAHSEDQVLCVYIYICTGVQQGDSLGPLLFCLAIHDIIVNL